MVSMYVDIRQAAELLAKFSTGNGLLPHVAIRLANEISDAARRGGLQFYTQYRDSSDGLMHVSDPANILGASFSIAVDENGIRYVKPNGYIEGEDRKAILQSQGHTYEPGPHDGEWVAHCVVSIEDVVKHPCFGFPREKQDRIIEAHKAAAMALLPVRDAAPAPTQKAETPAPVVVASEPAKPAARVDRGRVLKKAALINKYERQWQNMNRDFQDASENGLSNAAKAPEHGNWFEDDALNWARQRGKLSEATGQHVPTSPATPFDGLIHRIQG